MHRYSLLHPKKIYFFDHASHSTFCPSSPLPWTDNSLKRALYQLNSSPYFASPNFTLLKPLSIAFLILLLHHLCEKTFTSRSFLKPFLPLSFSFLIYLPISALLKLLLFLSINVSLPPECSPQHSGFLWQYLTQCINSSVSKLKFPS